MTKPHYARWVITTDFVHLGHDRAKLSMGCVRHNAVECAMRYTAESAFVLHARPWRETSLLVEVLSADHGRIGLLARGVHGPKKHLLRAALQPMQSIQLMPYKLASWRNFVPPRRWMRRRSCAVMR